MCEWACRRCGEAYLSNPPEDGLCTACQQQDEQTANAAAGEADSDDD
jgi:hypothetical protein